MLARIKFQHKISAKNLIFKTEDNVYAGKLKEKKNECILKVIEDQGVGSEVGSGSVRQRYGSTDPDPHQNMTDPQH